MQLKNDADLLTAKVQICVFTLQLLHYSFCHYSVVYAFALVPLSFCSHTAMDNINKSWFNFPHVQKKKSGKISDMKFECAGFCWPWHLPGWHYIIAIANQLPRRDFDWPRNLTETVTYQRLPWCIWRMGIGMQSFGTLQTCPTSRRRIQYGRCWCVQLIHLSCALWCISNVWFLNGWNVLERKSIECSTGFVLSHSGRCSFNVGSTTILARLWKRTENKKREEVLNGRKITIYIQNWFSFLSWTIDENSLLSMWRIRI